MSTSYEVVTLETSYIPAAVASARTLFSTLLNWEIAADPERKSKELQPGRDLSGIISFTGALRGMIVISFDKEVAFWAVEALLDEMPVEINADVCDTVAELANMVAGGVKDYIQLEDLALGMPATVSGTGHKILFDAGAEVESVLLSTPVGCVTIQIAVRRGTQSSTVSTT